MSNYKYIDPTSYGYTKIKLTKQEHKEIFKRYSIINSYEYFENKYDIKMHVFTKWYMKVINISLYPIALIFCGVENIRDLNKSISSMFNEREKGAFYSQHAGKSSLEQRGIKFKSRL